MPIEFDRPVFIVAAPRSCSTLLFQTLANSAALCSIGDESHAIFEGHRKLSPGRGLVDSNRFTADLLDDALARSIRKLFSEQIRDRDGNGLQTRNVDSVRLLEKTPKNSLRIPFLDALFPDALFVFLVRDPRQNISSIIEAWRSGRFATYRRLQTVHGPWSLLLPPGWRKYTERTLEEIAAFQWCSANGCILRDLAHIDRRRWTALNAADLIANPYVSVERLCAFIGIAIDDGWRSTLEQPLPPSRYTLTAPDTDKWRRNAAALARVWPEVAELTQRINDFASGIASPLSPELGETDAGTQPAVADAPAQKPAAAGAEQHCNRPCPCGSGLRYAVCHGRIRS